jgi:neutral ceramidase
LLDQQFTLVPAITQDTAPFMMNFGDVLQQTDSTVEPGELVKVVFAGGHPKHNSMREGTFLLVEKFVEGSARWDMIRTDADWDTK